jgi:hypothetical protein
MDLSEQAMNELERRLVEEGRSLAEPPECRAEPLFSDAVVEHTDDPDLDTSALRRELSRQRSDYRQLLLSYNDLSSAFRTHLTNSLNDYFTSIIEDLKHENCRLSSEKQFFLHTVHCLIAENYRLKTMGKSLEDFGIDFEGVEEMVLQNFFLKEKLQKKENERIGWLEQQLQSANEVIKLQEEVIQELKKEGEGSKGDGIRYAKLTGGEKKIKLSQAILEETRKESRLVKEKNLILSEKLETHAQEISNLRQQLVATIEGKESLQKHRDVILKENEYLNEISKEFERVQLGHILSLNQENIFHNLQEENLLLKTRIFSLEKENKSAVDKHNEEIQSLERDQGFKINEIVAKHKRSKKIKNDEIRRLSDQISKTDEKCADLEIEVEELKQELAENSKNLKKVVDELDGIKKVAGKRVAQLEEVIAGKNEEIAKNAFGTTTSLTKLIVILHKLQTHFYVTDDA